MRIYEQNHKKQVFIASIIHMQIIYAFKYLVYE